MLIDELIKFAKIHHAGFANVPDDFLRKMFETYRGTTLVNIAGGKICGFGIYQEWPNLLNFICIVGSGTQQENAKAMLKGRKYLPKKPIGLFDENEMRLKILCQ